MGRHLNSARMSVQQYLAPLLWMLHNYDKDFLSQLGLILYIIVCCIEGVIPVFLTPPACLFVFYTVRHLWSIFQLCMFFCADARGLSVYGTSVSLCLCCSFTVRRQVCLPCFPSGSRFRHPMARLLPSG